MENAGHRYKNIDRALGTGSYLLLGREVAETVFV